MKNESNKCLMLIYYYFDETELCAFFCPFSFYFMPLFLRVRKKRGKGRVMATKKCTEFHFIYYCTIFYGLYSIKNLNLLKTFCKLTYICCEECQTRALVSVKIKLLPNSFFSLPIIKKIPLTFIEL